MVVECLPSISIEGRMSYHGKADTRTREPPPRHARYASAGAKRGPPPSERWHPTATWSSSYHRLTEKGRKQISSESCSLICNLVLELARIPRMRSEVRISRNASPCGFHCICDSHRRPRYRRRFDGIQRGQCAAVTSASLPRSGTASWSALTDDF